MTSLLDYVIVRMHLMHYRRYSNLSIQHRVIFGMEEYL